MTATPIRGPIRFTRFILSPSVASRRYIYRFWNPRTLNGQDVKGKDGRVTKTMLKPGATQADVERYNAAVAANEGDNKILFRSKANMGPGAETVVYITDDPTIATYLRTEIRSGRLKAREDVSVAPLQCPWCDFFLDTSTPKDQEAMYFHHLDKHPERLNDMVGEQAPVAVPA